MACFGPLQLSVLQIWIEVIENTVRATGSGVHTVCLENRHAASELVLPAEPARGTSIGRTKP